MNVAEASAVQPFAYPQLVFAATLGSRCSARRCSGTSPSARRWWWRGHLHLAQGAGKGKGGRPRPPWRDVPRVGQGQAQARSMGYRGEFTLRQGFWLVVVIVAQDAVGVAVGGSSELTLLQHPPEGAQPDCARNRLTGIRRPRISILRSLQSESVEGHRKWRRGTSPRPAIRGEQRTRDGKRHGQHVVEPWQW